MDYRANQNPGRRTDAREVNQGNAFMQVLTFVPYKLKNLKKFIIDFH